MIIIHDMEPLLRLAAAAIAEAARAMPVIVLSGARQTGKSTLAHAVDPERAYLTLDDLDVLDQARTDPEALLGRAARVTLDEIQRQPDLLLAIERDVDCKRQRGRFLVTGSANLLLLEKASETLAGRATYLSLWPMTRREQLGRGRCGLWPELLAASDQEWPGVLAAHAERPEDWRELARRGGYPTPALELEPTARERWFAGYTQTYLERDLQQVSSIANLPDFRRLMRAVCLRLGQLMNQADLGRDVALPQPTVHRWLNLLEVSYQLVRLPAYAVNRTKRLIKAPKLYWSDTGLALHLVNGEASGPHLENLVLNDLLAWRDTSPRRPEVSYWRTAAGEEIDFVLELDGVLLPIEIEASDRPGRTTSNTCFPLRRNTVSAAARVCCCIPAPPSSGCRLGVLAAPWWAVL